MAHVSTVTINPNVPLGNVPEDQYNFPALLPTPPTDSAIWSDATPSGGDIRIFASDGTTEWAREIVSFDATAKTCEIWVKVPYLSQASDTVVQIHADGASSEPAFTDAVRGRNAVWADYDFVTHDGGATESSGLAYSPTNNGGVSPGAAAGKIGAATEFDGNDDNVRTNLSISMGSTWSITVWAYHDTPASESNFNKLLGSDNTDDNNRTVYIEINPGADTIRAVWRNGGVFGALSTTTAETAKMWAHYGFSLESGSGIAVRNGEKEGAATGMVTPVTNSNTLFIGNVVSSFAANSWDGSIDELRISTTKALTESWITTEYNNQSAPNTFATWADEAAVAVPVLGAITATAVTSNSISFSIPVTF